MKQFFIFIKNDEKDFSFSTIINIHSLYEYYYEMIVVNWGKTEIEILLDTISSKIITIQIFSPYGKLFGTPKYVFPQQENVSNEFIRDIIKIGVRMKRYFKKKKVFTRKTLINRQQVTFYFLSQ